MKSTKQENTDAFRGKPESGDSHWVLFVIHPVWGMDYVSTFAGRSFESVLKKGFAPPQWQTFTPPLTAMFSQQYGMTESNGPIVLSPPTRDTDILLNTTGKPDPRLELRIADENGTALPDGEEGEIPIRHPYPFAGYLVFCGRSKEMYKSGGFNVYPREIEIALEAHPAIRAAAVLGVDDDQGGQIGHTFVELAAEFSADDVKNWCKSRLADFKVPKRVSFVQAIPRTPVDKIDRMRLAEMIAE